VQSALKENKITMGHARAIINVEDPQKQQWLLEQMLNNEMSVRDVESMVRNANETETKKTEKPVKKGKMEEFLEYQQSLSNKFSSKVAIKADDKGRGSIRINFRSQAELQRILDLLD
jgi:ParB family chromosome partitioning protein